MNWPTLRNRMLARCILYTTALCASLVVAIVWVPAAPYAALATIVAAMLFAGEVSRWFYTAERMAHLAEWHQDMAADMKAEIAEAQRQRDAEDARMPSAKRDAEAAQRPF